MGGGRNARLDSGLVPPASRPSVISGVTAKTRICLSVFCRYTAYGGNTATDRSHQAGRSMGEECATKPALERGAARYPRVTRTDNVLVVGG